MTEKELQYRAIRRAVMDLFIILKKVELNDGKIFRYQLDAALRKLILT